MILFDFNKTPSMINWKTVNDVVMGGRSIGNFEINETDHLVFHSAISLENNGGFSSLRYQFDQKNIGGYSKITLRLKGDGKLYQVRLKQNKRDRHSYVYYFETSGNWQTISIPLSEMKPIFRGRILNMSNYPGLLFEQIAFLISNKKAETFRLEIDKITLL